jgi:N utilization substance protein B
MQSIFAFSYGNQNLGGPDFDDIVLHLKEIDAIITKNAPKWPLDKINKIDLSVLRCAFWELLYQKSSPPKVVIDEAIELAKEFGTESSPAFVNGVIGTAIKQIPIEITHES